MVRAVAVVVYTPNGTTATCTRPHPVCTTMVNITELLTENATTAVRHTTIITVIPVARLATIITSPKPVRPTTVASTSAPHWNHCHRSANLTSETGSIPNSLDTQNVQTVALLDKDFPWTLKKWQKIASMGTLLPCQVYLIDIHQVRRLHRHQTRSSTRIQEHIQTTGVTTHVLTKQVLLCQ